MAEDETPPKKTQKKRSKMLIPMLIVGSLTAVVLIQHSFMFFLAGMLPSIVAFIVDRSSHGRIFKIVTLFNLAGVFPFLLDIVWLHNNNYTAMQSKMGDPTVWFIMFFSAGIGWCMVWATPYLVMGILKGVQQGRIMHLESIQRRLEKEWGPEIKG